MTDGLELLGLPGGPIMGAGALGLYWIAAPSLKAVGNAFGEWTTERMQNVLRIGERVNDRLGGVDPDDGRAVPPRVLYEVINEGSWATDDVQQEYLAGLLLASRAPLGVGDEGAYFARMVTGMTANQIRLHYAVYDALVQHGSIFNIGIAEQKLIHSVWAPLSAAVGVIAPEQDDSLEVAITSAAIGLDRMKLLDTVAVGEPSLLNSMVSGDIGTSAFVVSPEISGAALYMWAHGLRSSDHERIFELRGRDPLGPSFKPGFVSPFDVIPTGWPVG